MGEELPVGWEYAYHPLLGVYFIDHNRRVNQLDDPRIEWLAVQANMVIGYLQQANSGTSAITSTNNHGKFCSSLLRQSFLLIAHIIIVANIGHLGRTTSKVQQLAEPSSSNSLHFMQQNSNNSKNSIYSNVQNLQNFPTTSGSSDYSLSTQQNSHITGSTSSEFLASNSYLFQTQPAPQQTSISSQSQTPAKSVSFKNVIENDYMNRRDVEQSLLLQQQQIQQKPNQQQQSQQQTQQTYRHQNLFPSDQNLFGTQGLLQVNNPNSNSKVGLQFDDNSDYAVIDSMGSNHSGSNATLEEHAQQQQQQHLIQHRNLFGQGSSSAAALHQHSLLINNQPEIQYSNSFLTSQQQQLYNAAVALQQQQQNLATGKLQPGDITTSSIPAIVSPGNGNQQDQDQVVDPITRMTRPQLEHSLTEAKRRVATLKRELDANYNLLTIIDKYYTRGDNSEANAIEV